MTWKIGSKIIRDPELGPGIVTAIEGRFIDVYFPKNGSDFRFSPSAANIKAHVFRPGEEVRIEERKAVIESIRAGMATLSDDSMVPIEDLWPIVKVKSLVEKLVSGKIDSPGDIFNRLDGFRLLNLRRKGLIPSLVGGRVELFPHQLDTAAKAISESTVRWILADEVGLGKTIVAAMITASMVRMGRVQSVLIIAPATLTIQWLGELYRKFHQVFVHIDAERIQDLKTDYGHNANPFEIHPLAVISQELLLKKPELYAYIEAAPPQMLVIDEAHQIIGSDIEYSLLPLAEHALLLTATPFFAGKDGFMRLVNALGCETKSEGDLIEVNHVSAVTRDDIHKLGTRVPYPISMPAFEEISANAPRVVWLIEHVKKWAKEGRKALIFVDDAPRAIQLMELLQERSQMQCFVFHEGMGSGERDIELSRFRLSKSPTLVSSGAGSEGRNFQFCDILVHFELPIDPVVLEQRIGRIDRIGRTGEIPIHYFTTSGPEGVRAKVYESIGIFESAAVGSSPALAGLREKLAFGIKEEELDLAVKELVEGLKIESARWVFPDSHQSEESESVLSQIPEGFDELVEKFTYESAEGVGLDIVEKEGFSVYFFEYGAAVEVDNIPGLDEGARFLGTFDREEALKVDMLDFFSNGHPLVEALLMELEDSERGKLGGLLIKPEQLGGVSGAFLFVVQGKEGVFRPQLIPLAAPAIPKQRLNAMAKHLLENLPECPTLAKSQVGAVMKKFKNMDAIKTLNPETLAQVLVVISK